MPSVFLADTSDAAWGTATVDSTGEYGAVYLHSGGDVRGGIYQLCMIMVAPHVCHERQRRVGTTTVDNTSYFR